MIKTPALLRVNIDSHPSGILIHIATERLFSSPESASWAAKAGSRSPARFIGPDLTSARPSITAWRYAVRKEAWMDRLFARIDLRAAGMHLCWVALLTIIAVLSASGQERSDGAEPVAEPAVAAILA